MKLSTTGTIGNLENFMQWNFQSTKKLFVLVVAHNQSNLFGVDFVTPQMDRWNIRNFVKM